ncbi:glycosyltransferase family 2 protein [Kitasatospora sp. NPDC058965]|uniref:glycosyltransferase family 2 protein n=1 Tax=Kitasatospora sp. NPDC058965 TaxID=3346682 RepID=UPI0036CF7137
MTDLWVVVPAYNEEASLPATLRALARQTDTDFECVVVDNGSTDRTPDVVREFAATAGFPVHLADEPRKGTGAAADTGMRYAIAAGARYLARTDADCLPVPGWTAAARRGLAGGLGLVTGQLRPRTDEFRLRLWESRLLPAVVSVAAAFGRIRPGNRDPQYLGPYLMCPGSNLAITAELYQRCGGFPRTAIEELHEDRALVNRVRRVTAAYGQVRGMKVYGSVRRLRAYGLRNTLAWYADHRFRPDVVDIR